MENVWSRFDSRYIQKCVVIESENLLIGFTFFYHCLNSCSLNAQTACISNQSFYSRFRKVFFLVHLFLHSNCFQLSDIFVICFDLYEKKENDQGVKWLPEMCSHLMLYAPVLFSSVIIAKFGICWEFLKMIKKNFQSGICNQLKFENPSNIFFRS